MARRNGKRKNGIAKEAAGPLDAGGLGCGQRPHRAVVCHTSCCGLALVTVWFSSAMPLLVIGRVGTHTGGIHPAHAGVNSARLQRGAHYTTVSAIALSRRGS